jgi:ketosteroid isomerase-like protein
MATREQKVTVATQRAIEEAERTLDEADIRRRIDKLVQAVRAMDLEGVKWIYAPDLVSFDIEPPLQHLGAEAKWQNWANVFAAYEPPLGYETRDLTITAGGDVAFGRTLARISGTLKNGNRSDYWVRWTTCFRKIDGQWLIAHDQISVPMDVKTGKALRDLKP